uniref:Centromere protein V n=1 Tax=Scophthalmus maximus TaxID=52904 RepID=A0A8D2ZD40_SCOMX
QSVPGKTSTSTHDAGQQTCRLFIGVATLKSNVTLTSSVTTSIAVNGMDLVKHKGGCHCEAVRFEVWSSPDLHVFHCNCSICTKKQNHHFIVPKNHFTLLQGLDNLTTYSFNTHVAQHTFCKTCGVQSFYTPRSNPDGYGIAPHCLDPGTVRSVTVEKFCGEKWEESMQAHKTIRDMS